MPISTRLMGSIHGCFDSLSLRGVGTVMLVLMGNFPLIFVEHHEILSSRYWV
jgi:hypothetical protein